MSHNLFKENYAGPVFLKRVFGHMNAVGRCLNNLRGVGGCEITPNEFGGLDIRAAASKMALFPWSIVSMNPQLKTAALRPGWVIHGVYNPQQVIGSLTVSGGTLDNPTYAVLEYSYTSRTASISPATTSQYPVSDATTFRCALHSFAVIDNRAVHVMQHQFSDIIIPGFA